VTRLKQACCVLTAGVAALTAAVATAATWPDQPAAALSATGQGGFRVGSAISATLLGGRPQVYYDDDGAASLRYARLTAAGWQFQTLDGPSSTLPGPTGDHVGSAVAVTQMNGNAQVYYYDATRGRCGTPGGAGRGGSSRRWTGQAP
jgi:hypothetical protein